MSMTVTQTTPPSAGGAAAAAGAGGHSGAAQASCGVHASVETITYVVQRRLPGWDVGVKLCTILEQYPEEKWQDITSLRLRKWVVVLLDEGKRLTDEASYEALCAKMHPGLMSIVGDIDYKKVDPKVNAFAIAILEEIKPFFSLDPTSHEAVVEKMVLQKVDAEMLEVQAQVRAALALVREEQAAETAAWKASLVGMQASHEAQNSDKQRQIDVLQHRVESGSVVMASALKATENLQVTIEQMRAFYQTQIQQQQAALAAAQGRRRRGCVIA